MILYMYNIVKAIAAKRCRNLTCKISHRQAVLGGRNGLEIQVERPKNKKQKNFKKVLDK